MSESFLRLREPSTDHEFPHLVQSRCERMIHAISLVKFHCGIRKAREVKCGFICAGEVSTYCERLLLLCILSIIFGSLHRMIYFILILKITQLI